MLPGLCRCGHLGEPAGRDSESPRPPPGGRATGTRRLFMVWQTPAATDIRFGFEITLYVAAR